MTYSQPDQPLSTKSTESTNQAVNRESVDSVDIVEGGRRAKPDKPVRLILLGDGSQRPFIGVHAIPNHLPEMLRYPGESAQAFSHRVLHAVTGSGVVRGMLMYPGESGSCQYPPAFGSSWSECHAGNSHRDIFLVGDLLARSTGNKQQATSS